MGLRSGSSFNVAATALFTALVCVATMMFSVYVPVTRGFFNVGESMVFLSALLFGPYTGAFAGGVGSMLADLLLGYPIYAPATLVIKACEGAVVGLLLKRNPRFSSVIQWRYFTMILGVVAGLLLGWVGTTYYVGELELSIGSGVFILQVPAALWIILSLVLALSIIALGFRAEPRFGWTVFSVIIGGFIMVSGYFIYQQFFIGPLFNIEVVALAEIPINIGQMIIGATIALPAAKVIQRALPNIVKQSATY